MKRTVASVLWLVLIAACGAPASSGANAPSAAQLSGSITVFAASSLTDAFDTVAEGFKAQHAGTGVTFNFGSSSTLAAQIGNGAPADVFASADEANMQKVSDADLVDGTPAIFATNRLEIAVAPGNPRRIGGLADLAKPGTVVVLAARTVPAGAYALDALAKAGVVLTPASQEVDVRAVLNKVALGEADAGIVYVTDVFSAEGRVSGVEIPERQQVVARYPIAVVRDSRNAALARAFVAYLLSDAGRRVLAGAGFGTP
jgi:molybdate transport system substrate-binding protein